MGRIRRDDESTKCVSVCVCMCVWVEVGAREAKLAAAWCEGGNRQCRYYYYHYYYQYHYYYYSFCNPT